MLSVGSHHWVHKYLTTLDSILINHNPNSIDFLIPTIAEEGPRTPLTAMSFPEALYFVRRYLELPWRTQKLNFADVSHYTLHGLKSTFISWASQLGISPELRRLQGKHKDPMQSSRLYSRDDVHGSFKLQGNRFPCPERMETPYTSRARRPNASDRAPIPNRAKQQDCRRISMAFLHFLRPIPEVHPASDSYIAHRAFIGCTQLSRLIKMEDKATWRGPYVERDTFELCDKLHKPGWINLLPPFFARVEALCVQVLHKSP